MERIKGFTIVELMVVMGIFGIISSVVVTIYFQIVQASNRASIAAEVEQNASYAMEIMVREIRSANCVSGESGNDDILYIKDADCEGTIMTFTIEEEDGKKNLVKKLADLTTHKLNDPGKVVAKSLSFGPGILDSSAKSVAIDLVMESAKPAPHTQFKGEISLHETVSLRKY